MDIYGGMFLWNVVYYVDSILQWLMVSDLLD